jgi:signal transduction histidine kinase
MPNETPVARCFLTVPGRSDESPVALALRAAIAAAGFQIVESPQGLQETVTSRSIEEAIAGADFVVADITGSEPSVFFELGLARALDKPSFLLTQGPVGVLPAGCAVELSAVLHYRASRAGLKRLHKDIGFALREFRRFPRRPRFLPGARARDPFDVDWEQLSREDVENLCLELLTQLGFRRLEWEKETPEIDVVAELPKKDPDGFEYRELWLVSLGRNAPPGVLMDMLVHDPEHFMHRVFRYSERFGPLFKRQELGDVPVTLLIITLAKLPLQSELFSLEERLRRRPFARTTPRIRVWDKAYLTGLVYQFPGIGFKYFSHEGRAQSKLRKTPEEIYRENLDLNRSLIVLKAELQDEKDRRVRAERDAVWKDISFAAAHKMGNPIFAIETNLDPLQRRTEDGRVSEAVTVINSIRTSVEKAKGIVEQFKSLTVAQQIKPVPTKLRPLLEGACSVATGKGVACLITCPPDLQVLGDPDRLGECFDELVGNAMHWFDKPERRIAVDVSLPAPGALREQLDSAASYALVHFRDNGPGVPLENKNKIFDAFFSTYHHGTGLGLALVRRIVEGHGGSISECGLPGDGADFEIYLPLPSQGSRSNGRSGADGEETSTQEH